MVVIVYNKVWILAFNLVVIVSWFVNCLWPRLNVKCIVTDKDENF